MNASTLQVKDCIRCYTSDNQSRFRVSVPNAEVTNTYAITLKIFYSYNLDNGGI